MNRSRDWLDQARGTLDHAWACFAAHQAEVAAARRVVEFCEPACGV
jgi:hypothetical protein